jgi:hypothetical protein
LQREGASLVHRPMPAGPAPWLTAVAPAREDLVVWGACRCTWDWRAALCARAGMPGVLGHALSLHAMHGGKAPQDPSAAQTLAGVRRGGMRPQASVSPAAMRATRDRRRRRMPLRPTRAERLAHLHKTTRQDHLPASGTKRASHAHREGSAARVADPAVPQRIAVALALLAPDAALRRDVALAVLQTATQHTAHTRALRRTVPGIGESLSLVLRYAIQALPRWPRGQAGVAACRRGQCAQASAGQRWGPSGAPSGKASRTWACAAAAGWCRRHPPPGPPSLARLAHTHGQGKAWTVLAQTRARAVDARVQRATAWARPRLLPSEAGAERGRPPPHWPHAGGAWPPVLGPGWGWAACTPARTEAVDPQPCAGLGQPLRR